MIIMNFQQNKLIEKANPSAKLLVAQLLAEVRDSETHAYR